MVAINLEYNQWLQLLAQQQAMDAMQQRGPALYGVLGQSDMFDRFAGASRPSGDWAYRKPDPDGEIENKKPIHTSDFKQLANHKFHELLRQFERLI